MKCNYTGCNKEATFNIIFDSKNDTKEELNIRKNGNYCTEHKKELSHWYDNKTPIGYKKFDINDGWIDIETGIYPDNFKSIEISDGEIIDRGYMLGANWYYYNYHEFISNKKKYWRYI